MRNSSTRIYRNRNKSSVREPCPPGPAQLDSTRHGPHRAHGYLQWCCVRHGSSAAARFVALPLTTGGIRSQPGLTLSGSWEPATSPLGLKRWGFVVHLYKYLAFPLSLLKHNSRRDITLPLWRVISKACEKMVSMGMLHGIEHC